MLRFVTFDIVLFLVPFALYGAWLAASRQPVGVAAWQTRTIAWLAIAGAVLMVVVLVAFVHFNPAAPGGAYVPAHIENGHVVEGHIAPASK